MKRFFPRLLMLAGLAPVASLSAYAATQPSQLCFNVPTITNCIDGRFREFWEQNGGLPVFGYPVSSAHPEVNADTGTTYLTQYFERQRFELHPDQARPYDVLLGRLGDDRLREKGKDWHALPVAAPTAPHYFAATQHAIAAEVWSYWRSHGLELGDAGVSERESLALFGLPISEPQVETNSSGDTVETQHFERATLELHPDKPANNGRILQGRLGSEVAEAHHETEPHETETAEPRETETTEPRETKTVEPSVTETTDPRETETAEPHETHTAEPHKTHTAEPSRTSEPHETRTAEPSRTSEPHETNTVEPTHTSEPHETNTVEPTHTAGPHETHTAEPTRTTEPHETHTTERTRTHR